MGFANAIVVLIGLWLIGLAIACILVPARTRRFLRSFASSARAHYTEQLVRLVAGSGLVIASVEMQFAAVWRWFGWIILATTVVLLLIPWRWHRRFAKSTVPAVERHLSWFALGSLLLGIFLLLSAWGASS